MKPKAWYLKEYGEDWAEIVYAQDLKEDKFNQYIEKLEQQLHKSKNKPAAWATDGINE